MRTHLFTIATALYVVACVFLGGASAAGLIANALLQVAGLALAVFAVRRLLRDGVDPRARQPLLILAAIFAVGLLQLIPLSPSIWTLLPGRGDYAVSLLQLDIRLPWLGISLAPEATLSAMLALIPAAAAFLSMLALSQESRRWVARAIVAAAGISTLLGLSQIAVGGALYFYAITNMGSSVGFFSNKNHFATLLLVAIPLLEAVRTTTPASNTVRSTATGTGVRVATYAAIAFFVMGVAAAESRAGLALLFPALLLTFALHRRLQTGVISRPMLLGAFALAALAVAAVMLGPQGTRLAQKTASASEEVRVYAAGPTFQTAMRNMPLGTGLGTFEPVYRAATSRLGPNYVNHAHDDYLELLLTAGLPGIAVLLWFLYWYVGVIGATWRQRPTLPGSIPRAATVVIGLVLLHSTLDYPLRTAAISAIFAVACAMLVPPAASLHRRRVQGQQDVKPARIVRIT